MAATIRASVVTGASPTLANAETGVRFGRSETQVSEADTPRPDAVGTNYSYPKVFCLEVTVADTTEISNRRIRLGSSPQAGITLSFRDDGDTYQRGNAAPTASGSNDAAPSGYTLLTTSDAVYDLASDVASVGRSGDYISVVAGVSFLYASGSQPNLALPDILITYDES